MQQERTGGLPAWVLSNKGLAFSVILVVAWNVSCTFSKIFPFIIHVAYYWGSCVFTLFAYFQRHLSPNKWLNNIPSPKEKRITRSLVKVATHFRQRMLENQALFFPEHARSTNVRVREEWEWRGPVKDVCGHSHLLGNNLSNGSC